MKLDVCITCGSELAVMERNRAECWDCLEKTVESYDEEMED